MNIFIMQNSIVRPLGRDMQNVLIGFVGEHEARTFFVRTRDDLTGYTISLVIGDVDCGAMTKAPMPDGSTMLSLTLTSDMLGKGGDKVCQLLMVKDTIVRKSSQFRAYVGASNDINSTAPDSATIIIISEKITELVHKAAFDAIEEVQEVIDSIPADYSTLSAQVDTNTEDITGLKADLVDVNDSVNDLKSAIKHYNSFNIIPFRSDGGTVNGITFTPNGNDESYTVSGTATANTYFTLFNSTSSLPEGLVAGGTYNLQYDGAGKVYLQMYKYNSQGVQTQFLACITSTTFTVPQDAVGLLIRLNVPSSTSIGDAITVKPIVLFADTNLMLTEKVTELDEKVTGLESDTNLIPWRTDTLQTNGITYTPNGDGTYTVNGTATANAYYNLIITTDVIKGLEPGTLHTLSFTSDGTVKAQIYVSIDGTLTAFMSVNESGNYVFNIPESGNILLRLRVDNGATVNNANIEISIRASNLPEYDTVKKYVAFGDSVMVGSVWSPVPGVAAHRVKREWTVPARIALAIGMENAYVNMAVGGAGYITKVDGSNIVDEVKSYNYNNTEIVTIHGGANDKLKAAISLGTYNATAGDGTICGAIKEIIDFFKTNHPKIQVVFLQPMPSGIPTGQNVWSTSRAGGWSMNDFDEQVSKLCHDNHVGYCNWWECTYCNSWNEYNIGYNNDVGPNYTHPIVDFDYCILGDFMAGKVSSIFHSHT